MSQVIHIVRVTGNPDKSGFASALDRHADLTIFLRGGVGMVPPDGPVDVENLSLRTFSVHVSNADSKEQAQQRVESVIAEVDGAHSIIEVSDPIDVGPDD